MSSSKFLFADNDDMDSLVDEMFHVGGALLVTAVQLIVARTLIRNPENYAELVEADQTGSDSVFKHNKDIQSMRDFVVADVLGKSMPKPATYARKDLLKQFDSPRKTVTVRGSTSQITASSSEQESSSSSSEDEREKEMAILEPSVSKPRSTFTNTSKLSRLPPEEKQANSKKVVQPQTKTKQPFKGKRNPLELLAEDDMVVKKAKKTKSQKNKDMH